MSDFQELSTVEEVNNSLHEQYKKQKGLVNNLFLVIVVWFMLILLGTMLTRGSPDLFKGILLVGGISIFPLFGILMYQMRKIGHLNKHIDMLNIQKDIFTEKVTSKEQSLYTERLKHNHKNDLVMTSENKIGMVDINR